MAEALAEFVLVMNNSMNKAMNKAIMNKAKNKVFKNEVFGHFSSWIGQIILILHIDAVQSVNQVKS